uniref:WGS project CAEQ00000000 data, annotated contig 659 n=1 Tax=Trypanosoma congolense (strain IL3000) TaxID=1068625 RepID=F9WHJ8_TRYCI|nr:unnamed protein product [Trypanosoma congolense IL3000]
MQGSFSSGTCTDDPLPVPCTQLRTNRCVPLLWLPASLCLQLSSSEEGKNSDRTGCSEGYCVNTDINNTNVRRAVQQMSGFERNVLFEVLRQPFASMQSMQNLFPASESYYCEDAVLELLVHVATDATSIVPSRWASMEAHRDIAIVMVVLNCHEHEPNSAVRAINTVFQRHFTRCACRCVVLDPLEDTVADMPKDVVLTVSTRTPLKDVVIRVLSDIATATVRHLNTRIVEIMASHAAVKAIPRTATVGSSDGFNRFMIPGNVDDSSNSNSRNSNMVQQDVSTCGMMKRKGDFFR